MTDKSPRQHLAKRSEKSLKQKRADKRARASTAEQPESTRKRAR